MKHGTAVRMARHGVPVLLGMFLALTLVVVGPGAPPASASIDAPPKPVTVPGSAYKGDKITPLGNGTWYNRGVSGNTSAFVNGLGSSVLTKKSVPYMVMQGSNLAYTFSTSAGAADLKMHDPLTWAACTITLGAGDPCADPLVKAGQFVPNDDIEPGNLPGWEGYPNVSWSINGGPLAGSQLTAQVNVNASPDWNQPGRVEYATTFTYPSTGQWWDIIDWQGNTPILFTYVVGSNGPVQWGSVPIRMYESGGKIGNPQPGSVNLPAGYGLDHLELRGTASGPALATWYPPGHQSRPPETDMNPRRALQTRWECSQGPGGMLQSSWFREADSSYPPPREAKCAQGEVVEYAIIQITEGQTAEETMYRWEASDEYRQYLGDWENSPDKDAPLDLGILGQGSEVLSCFSDPSKCAGWWDKPDKGQTMVCRKGATVLPLEDCNAYRPTFDPDKQAKGQVYGDPRDGALPDPKPVPPAAPDSSPSGGACFPSGWNVFNPVEWVLKPVSCALTWAFIPTNSAAHLTAIRTAVGASTIGQWNRAVTGMFDIDIVEGGCAGPRLQWEFAHLDIYPFSACQEPVRTWASWTRIILTGTVVITGSMAALRAIGSGIGWKPSAGGDS